MNKLTLTKAQAKELTYGGSVEGLAICYNEITHISRWESTHELVVYKEKTDQYFRSYYTQGLTESQDSRAYDNDAPDFTEVLPHKVEITIYKDKI